MTLSVIIPTYNRPEFVVDCVESLNRAGVEGIEIVVVDDGSTDRTREVVEGLGCCRYIFQENQGPAAARNNGFSRCTGEYVAFVDSDDRWFPGVAGTILNLFERHPEVDVIFTDAQMGNEHDGFQSWIEIAGEKTFAELPSRDDTDGFRVLEKEAFFRRMAVRNAVFISAVVMRRRAFETSGGFDPKLCGAADWELWLRMASTLQFGFFPEALSVYTRHDNCMSNDHEIMRADFIGALESVRNKCVSLSNADRDLVSKQLSHHLFSHAYSAYDRGDLKLARTRFQDLAQERSFTFQERLIWLVSWLSSRLGLATEESEKDAEQLMADEKIEMSTTIVVLNFNGLEDTRNCLNSIQSCAVDGLTTLVVDNASDEDPTSRLKAEFPWCEVIRNEVNGGWAGGNNVGIRRALELGSDSVVLLNNDTIVSPGLVQRLRLAAELNPEYGIIGPVINHMERPNEIQTEGCLFNRPNVGGFFTKKSVLQQQFAVPSITEVDIVNGCCMMILTKVFEKIDLIDERFFLIHEESDFCLRAQQAGFRCGVIGESLVWHRQSVSFYRAGKRFQCYYDVRNLQLLLRKHLGRHRQGRTKMISWLDYLRTTYYRYCLECEHHQLDSAHAVIEGFCDGFAGRFGPWRARRRLLLGSVLRLFEAVRWLKSRTARS